MNYSNRILDYSRYNYICLPKAGSQHLFRGLVVHIMDCLGNNNRIEWYRTKDVEPPEGTWLWTIEPAYKYNKKTGKLEEVLPKAIAPDRNSWDAKTKKWSFHNSGPSNNLYWTYPVYPESL